MYFGSVAKALNEAKGFGGEIAGNSSNSEFLGERDNNFTIETIVQIEEVLKWSWLALPALLIEF